MIRHEPKHRPHARHTQKVHELCMSPKKFPNRRALCYAFVSRCIRTLRIAELTSIPRMYVMEMIHDQGTHVRHHIITLCVLNTNVYDRSFMVLEAFERNLHEFWPWFAGQSFVWKDLRQHCLASAIVFLKPSRICALSASLEIELISQLCKEPSGTATYPLRWFFFHT